MPMIDQVGRPRRTNNQSPLPISRVFYLPSKALELQGEKDDKIIAVCADDPEYRHYNDISELSPHRLQEIRRFFEDCTRACFLSTSRCSVMLARFPRGPCWIGRSSLQLTVWLFCFLLWPNSRQEEREQGGGRQRLPARRRCPRSHPVLHVKSSCSFISWMT